jgi:hypothetical protein
MVRRIDRTPAEPVVDGSLTNSANTDRIESNVIILFDYKQRNLPGIFDRSTNLSSASMIVG